MTKIFSTKEYLIFQCNVYMSGYEDACNQVPEQDEVLNYLIKSNNDIDKKIIEKIVKEEYCWDEHSEEESD